MIRTLTAVAALLAAPALADTPRVVVDIAPVHALVSQVMAGAGTPDLLLDRSDNPHHAQLRPSQARVLSKADLVVWVGPALSPWLGDALAALGTADQIVLLDRPETHLDAGHGAPHAEHDHDHHDHGGINPHVWLSSENAARWLTLFADELGTQDPANAALYHQNAEAAVTRLSATMEGIRARLAPYEGTPIVTFHDAFGYFTEPLGIEVVGTVRPSDAAAPTAADIATLNAVVQETGARCAFAEPGYDPAVLQTLSDDSEMTLGTLDPRGALLPPGPEHYSATLEALADSLVTCLETTAR